MAFTNRPREILGPLTTVFTPPAQCTVAVGGGSTANMAWLGQRCNPEVEDDPGCWPATTEGAPATSQPLYGWGFYSPGIECPAGYTSACTAIAGQSSGWKVQYQMEAEETFVGCCPTGFKCDNLNGQTCIVHPTATTIPTVSCESGSSNNFGYTTLPNAWVSQLHLFAPMIQLAWKPSDRSDSSSMNTSSSTVTSSTASAPTSVSSTPPSQIEASLSTGTVIGIAIGAAVAFLLIAGAAILVWWRRRRQVGHASPGGSDWPEYKAGGYSAVGADSMDHSEAKQFHHVYTGVAELEPNSRKAEMPADSLGPAEMPGGDGRYHAPRPVEMPAQWFE